MAQADNDLSLFNELARELFALERSEPTAPRVHPEKVKELLNIALTEESESDENLKQILRELIRYTPKTGSRLFVNQLYGGRENKALLGDLLAVVLNNSMYTYKTAGPQVEVEREVLRKSIDLIGYPQNADGIFAPGGSLSNFMALVAARDSKCPHFSKPGSDSEPIAYASEESHYSIPKNMRFAGLGTERLRLIPAGDQGRMCPGLFREQVQRDLAHGFRPFFVTATAGTTVAGAFDDINAVADVCREFDLFLHVDGAYCGSAIFSERYKKLLKGVERSDSFSYNAHKMMGTPLTCSVLLLNDGELLNDSFSEDADYLFQSDGDEHNPAKRSMQCGRRNDALKLWVLWKSVGTKGLGEIVEHRFKMADFARDYIRSRNDYKLHDFGDTLSVCFNYKSYDPVDLALKLYENGVVTVSHGQFRGEKFIRLVTVNAGLDKYSIMEFFKKLEEFAGENKIKKAGDLSAVTTENS